MDIMKRACKFERMNVERLFARAFVIVGGVFWVTAVFGANFVYEQREIAEAITNTLPPLAAVVFTLVVGWFYERLAALLLFAGSLAAIVYGVVAGWELGVWITIFAFIVAPMLLAAVLFLLASRMQNICELEGHPEV